MGQERLSSLSILHIHREEESDLDTVVDIFLSLKNRRIVNQ